MRYALVQGVMKETVKCCWSGGIEICVDETIVQMHPDKIHLDFVPSQGYKLYTDSEYLATHLRLHSHLAEI